MPFGARAAPGEAHRGYRDFDTEAVERLLFIRRAKELGFTLTEIKQLLDLRVDSDRSCDDVRILAKEKMRDIGERIRSLHPIELALQRLVKLCATEGAGGSCLILVSPDFAFVPLFYFLKG